ncbi:SRPBCC domain-containing protein [Vannielia sp. SX4]|uniref:SRPBCC domain-containing protein n=1 Tax=Vannielia sp. SX4 TaxID=3463852 RepID=UPI004058062D
MSALTHDTLTLTQSIAAPPARLFPLLTSPEYRAQWAAPTENTRLDILHADIRPGGQELSRCGPADNPEFEVTTDFHHIEAPTLLIFTETIRIEGAPLSAGLCSIEITPEGAGSRLTITAQLASLIGDEMAEGYTQGWTAALANLARLAEKETA